MVVVEDPLGMSKASLSSVPTILGQLSRQPTASPLLSHTVSVRSTPRATAVLGRPPPVSSALLTGVASLSMPAPAALAAPAGSLLGSMRSLPTHSYAPAVSSTAPPPTTNPVSTAAAFAAAARPVMRQYSAPVGSGATVANGSPLVSVMTLADSTFSSPPTPMERRRSPPAAQREASAPPPSSIDLLAGFGETLRTSRSMERQLKQMEAQQQQLVAKTPLLRSASAQPAPLTRQERQHSIPELQHPSTPQLQAAARSPPPALRLLGAPAPPLVHSSSQDLLRTTQPLGSSLSSTFSSSMPRAVGSGPLVVRTVSQERLPHPSSALPAPCPSSSSSSTVVRAASQERSPLETPGPGFVQHSMVIRPGRGDVLPVPLSNGHGFSIPLTAIPPLPGSTVIPRGPVPSPLGSSSSLHQPPVLGRSSNGAPPPPTSGSSRIDGHAEGHIRWVAASSANALQAYRGSLSPKRDRSPKQQQGGVQRRTSTSSVSSAAAPARRRAASRDSAAAVGRVVAAAVAAVGLAPASEDPGNALGAICSEVAAAGPAAAVAVVEDDARYWSTSSVRSSRWESKERVLDAEAVRHLSHHSVDSGLGRATEETALERCLADAEALSSSLLSIDGNASGLATGGHNGSFSQAALELSIARKRSADRRRQELYRDNEMRQRRWLVRFKEKRQQEEEQLQSLLQVSKPARSFNEYAFNNWYDAAMCKWAQAEERRSEQRDITAQQRSDLELAECSFAPEKIGAPTKSKSRCSLTLSVDSQSAPSSPVANGTDPTSDCIGGLAAGPHSPQSRGSPMAWAPSSPVALASSIGSPTTIPGVETPLLAQAGAISQKAVTPSGDAVADRRQRKAQEIADELVAAQVMHMESLRKLDVQESEAVQQEQVLAAQRLRELLQEGLERVQGFATTEEGRALLASRTKDYLELNEGLSESVAAEEARQDLLNAGEAKVREQSASDLRQTVDKVKRSFQLERLKVAHELIRLHQTYEELLQAQTLSRPMFQGFDVGLVERVKSEAWYKESRELAFGLLRSQAEAAAERAAASNLAAKGKKSPMPQARRGRTAR
eukprot:TRINITY_DN113367_c0_g1_i1.p1 TRINITY_DN113367_c0_g1~~TRINITY_DN113367_c0_g1_i1.p1  ORF type:complete len:1063 (+),score=220.13 TRINITY_DN113367_c0_g1_i1:189-3377(+)